MIDWSRVPYLRVSTDFLTGLRDFSVTGRIGELAQGVSYAYWKWSQGYSWISDFGPWASKLVPPYSGKKSPDFVMVNLVTSKVAIMEAKGTQSSDHSSPMNAALRQCKAALAEKIPVTHGFGSVLTLDTAAGGVGRLHIRDPEVVAEISDEMRHDLFRRSYASWFDLVGDDEQAALCRGISKNIDRSSLKNDPAISKDDFQRSVNPLRDITSAAIGFDPSRTKFQIDPEVRMAIGNFNNFKSIDWKQFAERMRSPGDLNKKLIRFPDGTSITEH
jgi:hypothetical protein